MAVLIVDLLYEYSYGYLIHDYESVNVFFSCVILSNYINHIHNSLLYLMLPILRIYTLQSMGYVHVIASYMKVYLDCS